MKIKKITVSNLKAVINMTADFNGCTAIITGGNNKGKTSFLRGLIDRLRGLKPDQIVRHGESEMNAELELTTGEKFQWSIKDGSEKLFYITSEEIKVPITKAISERYFPQTFDIDRFLNEQPKQQRKMLQELSGIDFSIVEAEYKTAFDNRTFLNRKLQEEKAKVLPVNNDLPENITPTIELQKELNTIDLHNEKYANSEKIANQINSDIEKLQLQLKELHERKKQADIWLSDKVNKPKTNVEELNKKISEIWEQNNLIENNNKAKEQQKIFENAELAAKKADETVKSIEVKKIELIKSANLPEGFAFTDDGIEINGLPVTREQLSTSGIYIASLKLAAMKLGKVQTLHFDASHLDKNNLLEVEKWAESQGLQLLIERPDFEGGEIQYQIIQSK
jgi:recombinational DNA repair ATPase RecF